MVAAFILTNQNNIAFQFLKHYFNFSNNYEIGDILPSCHKKGNCK